MGGSGSKTPQEAAAAEFAKYDINGDQSLCKSEFRMIFQELDKKVWTTEKIDLLFNAMDSRRDGVIKLDEFVNFLMADQDTECLVKSASGWLDDDILRKIPQQFNDDVLQTIWLAGLWANKHADEKSTAALLARKPKIEPAEAAKLAQLKADSQKAQSCVTKMQEAISSRQVLTPGACTQLRDMAIGCALLAVSEFRQAGQGASENRAFLQKAIDPKPYCVTEKLWRSVYDLCWASARYQSYVALGDFGKQAEEKENFRNACGTVFSNPAAFTEANIDQKLLRWDSDYKEAR